jgi:hypothetical protein
VACNDRHLCATLSACLSIKLPASLWQSCGCPTVNLHLNLCALLSQKCAVPMWPCCTAGYCEGIIIQSLGSLVSDASGHVLPQHLYPAGYSATRTLRSSPMPSQTQTQAAGGEGGDAQHSATFVSSITKGPQGPVFRVGIRPAGEVGSTPLGVCVYLAPCLPRCSDCCCTRGGQLQWPLPAAVMCWWSLRAYQQAHDLSGSGPDFVSVQHIHHSASILPIAWMQALQTKRACS